MPIRRKWFGSGDEWDIEVTVTVSKPRHSRESDDLTTGNPGWSR